MKAKTIKAVLIDTDTKKTRPVQFKDELPEIYKLLKCRCIDIVTRKFGGRKFQIICDDEGLLAEFKTPAIATLDKNGKCLELIVGNCLIVKHDEEGNTKSLTNEEIVYLLGKCVKFNGYGQVGLIASI